MRLDSSREVGLWYHFVEALKAEGVPCSSRRSKGSLLNAKAQTAEFFRKLADLGDPPASDSADMSVFYATLLVLDKEFKSRLEQCLITEPCLMEKGGSSYRTRAIFPCRKADSRADLRSFGQGSTSCLPCEFLSLLDHVCSSS